MNITLLKYPTDEDWALAKQCALVTIGVAKKIRELVIEQCPEFVDLLAPPCVQTLVCREMYPCKYENVLTWRVPYGHDSGN